MGDFSFLEREGARRRPRVEMASFEPVPSLDVGIEKRVQGTLAISKAQ